jgi:hypothetical protein
MEALLMMESHGAAEQLCLSHRERSPRPAHVHILFVEGAIDLILERR